MPRRVLRRHRAFTIDDYTDMVLAFDRAGQNTERAAREYREQFPNRRHPHSQTFIEVFARWRRSGNVAEQHADAGRPRHVLQPVVEERIERAFEDDPNTSCREVGREMGISHSRVHAVIKDTGKHPYHYRRVQELLPGDYD